MKNNLTKGFIVAAFIYLVLSILHLGVWEIHYTGTGNYNNDHEITLAAYCHFGKLWEFPK
jgi:hypothetical protein